MILLIHNEEFERLPAEIKFGIGIEAQRAHVIAKLQSFFGSRFKPIWLDVLGEVPRLRHSNVMGSMHIEKLEHSN